MAQPEPTPLDDAIRVLHVDDEETQLKFAKAFLEMADQSIHIESVASPEEALRLLKTEAYDCVVSDFQMPGMDGIEFARRIREFSDIPLIIYTGRGSEEVAEAAFTGGIDDYIRKEINPSHYQVLAKRIRAAVEKHRAENALKESEVKYRSLVQDSRDGVMVFTGSELVYANHQTAALHGCSNVEELMKIGPRNLLHPEDREWVEERSLTRQRGEDLPPLSEFRLVLPDGTVRTVQSSSSVIEYSGKTSTLAFLRDTTERRKMEEEVIHLNRLLRAIRNVNQLIVQEGDRDKLLDGITRLLVETGGYFNAWIALFDEEGRFVSAAQSGLGDGFQPLLEMIEGDEPPECGRKALEQPGVHVIGDPVSECADCPLSGSYHGRSALSVRLEHGGTVYGLLAASVLRHLIPEEKKMLFKEIADDIGYALRSLEVEDERKRGEWTLRERVKELNCLYGLSNLVDSDLDLEGILGGVVALIPPAMQHPEEACVRITLEGRSYETDIFRETSQVLSADIKIQGENVGSLMVCYLEEVPEGEGDMFLPEEGELVNAIAERLGRITEHKRLEEEHRNYSKKLESRIEERTRELLDAERMTAAGGVAAMVGHDLRGPLQTIKNAIYLLNKNPESLGETLRIIDDAVDRATMMLQEFREQTRKAPLTVSRVDLGALMAKALEGAIIPEGVNAVVEVGEGLESVPVDTFKFRRVIDNLIRNAVEAMPKGGELRVEAHLNVGEILVEVSDTGEGIPEEVMGELFKPFHTTKAGGLGLGLAYSKRAIEAHGGLITVKSEVNKGTTFTVSLPMNPSGPHLT